jgi:hypothetical protein
MSPWSHYLLKGIALLHTRVRTAKFNEGYECSVLSLYYKGLTMMHNCLLSAFIISTPMWLCVSAHACTCMQYHVYMRMYVHTRLIHNSKHEKERTQCCSSDKDHIAFLSPVRLVPRPFRITIRSPAWIERRSSHSN